VAGKSPLEYIESLPREIIYTILIICLAIPLVKPLFLPVPVSPRVVEWHEYIENLPDGAYVLFSVDYGVGSLPALEPFAVATLHDLFSKNVKVVLMTLYSDGPICYRSLIAQVNPDAYGKKYGEDYVFLGYIPGTETAMKAIAENLPGAVPTDYKGTPITDIPMMKGITGARNFAMIISITPSGDVSQGWVRQWVGPYGVTYLCCVLAMMMPTMEPYYPAQVKALTDGGRAGEYEFIIGKPGSGLRKLDAFTVAHIMLMAAIIMGNIAYFALKAQKKGGA